MLKSKSGLAAQLELFDHLKKSKGRVARRGLFLAGWVFCTNLVEPANSRLAATAIDVIPAQAGTHDKLLRKRWSRALHRPRKNLKHQT